MISFIKKNLTFISLLFLGMIIANLLTLVLPLGLKMAIDSSFNNINEIYLISLGLLGAVIIKGYLQWIIRIKSSQMTEDFINNLSIRIYTHALNLSLSEINFHKPSRVISYLIQDINRVKLFSLSEVFEGLYSILFLVLSLMIIGFIHFELMLYSTAFLALAILMLLKVVPTIKDGYQKYHEAHQQGILRAQEAMIGISLVKLSDCINQEKDHFKNQLNIASKNYLNNQRLLNGALGIIDSILGCALVVVLVLGAIKIGKAQMTAGMLAVFYSYLLMMIMPILRIGGLSGGYQQAKLSWIRIQEFLSIPIEKNDRTMIIGPENIKGYLHLNAIEFYYRKGVQILDGISFNAHPGQTIGIVGPSGSGKTTLVYLLMGLLKSTKGQIRFDGWNINDISRKVLSRHMGVVFQDEHLFSDTIYNNIIYGLNNSSIHEVKIAAKVARASSFIEELNEGYETVLNDRGLNLSGGQRQRIAIARAIVRRPKVLILDEATCALDAITENEVQKSIQEFLPETLIITVAHRFSSIMNADQILVLQNGRILEQGEHNYLLSQNGLYSTLYFEQFKKNDH